MRQWPTPTSAASAPPGGTAPGAALGGMIQRLGEAGFETAVLASLQPLLPAASWSVYRTGPQCRPTLFMSASIGIPDTTRDCWWAYLSGPYLHDSTWGGPDRSQGAARTSDARPGAPEGFRASPGSPASSVPCASSVVSIPAVAPATRLCHITAQEVGGEHQARVYEAHGMVERVSIYEPEADGSLFAVNFYRHQHQAPLSDGQIADFEGLAPALLALARKHIALTRLPGAPALSEVATRGASAPTQPAQGVPPAVLRERLLQAHAGLTGRELDVCVRLLQGMTQEGIACDLGLSVPTVKTYRNRAFVRLGGIHFRNELFALVAYPAWGAARA